MYTVALMFSVCMSYLVSAAASYNVELLYDAKAGVAEGPVYDSSRHQLLWVDIEVRR